MKRPRHVPIRILAAGSVLLLAITPGMTAGAESLSAAPSVPAERKKQER